MCAGGAALVHQNTVICTTSAAWDAAQLVPLCVAHRLFILVLQRPDSRIAPRSATLEG